MSDSILAGYRLLERVGTDALGAVHLASPVDREGLFWLHLLPPWTPERQSVFTDTMERVVRIRVPGALAVIDHGVTSTGRLYFVEHHSDGLPLDVLRGQAGPLSARQAALLISSIAETLAGAHAAGVHHGNVAPSSILVDRQGNVCVRGLGIAECLGEAPTATSDVRALGALARECVSSDGEIPAAVQASPLARILDIEHGEQVPDAALAHAGMRRILGEMGVEDAAVARAACCEEWSLFFLLHRTFTSEHVAPPSESSHEGAQVPTPEPEPNSAVSAEKKEMPEKARSPRSGIVPVEISLPPPPEPEVRPTVSEGEENPSNESSSASSPESPGFQMPSPARKDGLAELHRQAEREAEQAARLHRFIGVAVAAVAVLGLLAAFIFLQGPATDEEIRSQARAELVDEMDAYSPDMPRPSTDPVSSSKGGASPPRTYSSGEMVGGILRATEVLRCTGARLIPESWLIMANALQPDSSAVLAARGIWLEREDWRRAESLLKARVLRDSPLEVVVALAQLYRRQGKPEEAMQVLRRVSREGQEDPGYMDVLAGACEDRGDFVGALSSLERLHATGLRSIAHLERLGVARLAVGQWNLAAEHFREVLERDSLQDTAAWGYVSAAEGVRNRGRTDRMISDLLGKVPSLAPVHLHLAERGLRERKYPTVTRHLGEFQRLRPEAWEGAFTRSNLHFRRGEWKEAVRGYAKLRSMRPSDSVIAFNQGMSQLALKSRGKGKSGAARAKAFFEEAARLDAHQWQARCELGKVHQRQRDMPSAKSRYREVAALNPGHPWMAQAVRIDLNSAQGDYLLTRPCYFPEIFEDASHARQRRNR